MTVSVRRWALADLPTIQRLLLETWLEAYESFIPRADLTGYLHAQYSQAKLEALLADQDVTGLVAEVDGVVAVMRSCFITAPSSGFTCTSSISCRRSRDWDSATALWPAPKSVPENWAPTGSGSA